MAGSKKYLIDIDDDYIYNRASKLYFEGIESGIIKATTPLCFRSLALKSNLEPLVAQFRAGKDLTAYFTLQSSGEVIFHNILGYFSGVDMDNYISHGQISKISEHSAKILSDAKYIDYLQLEKTHVPSGKMGQIKQIQHPETKDTDDQQKNVVGLR